MRENGERKWGQASQVHKIVIGENGVRLHKFTK